MFRILRNHLPLLAFLSVATVGGVGAGVLWSAAGRTEQLRFAAAADEATDRLGARMRLHVLLIEVTAAIIEAQGDALTAPRFADYFSRLDVADRYAGIAALGYAPLLSPRELPALTQRLEANYGEPIEVWPKSDANLIAPVVITNSSAASADPVIGFDMFSEPRRRSAMLAAIGARAPRATAPLNLAADDQPRPGFVIYAPIYGDAFGAPRRDDPARTPTGFAYGAFRIGELASAALGVLPTLPVSMTITEADRPEEPLHAFGEAVGEGFWRPAAETRSLDVLGHGWTIEFRPSPEFDPASGRWLALAFGAISTAFAAAAAFGLWEQAQAHAAARALVLASERSVAEKDLLLQEMKHRIKNAIARILAIARQTAAQSQDLAAFNESFTQRLQAMAEAQDMLTRSATEKADLAELLSRELMQVFGADFDLTRLRGEKVALDSTQTQALGLVFHELATNALKYGGAAGRAPTIDVDWRVRREGRPELDLRWRESGGEVGGPPERTGFGTRLIEASVRYELGGRIERIWEAGGLNLRVVLPLATAGPEPQRPRMRGSSASRRPSPM